MSVLHQQRISLMSTLDGSREPWAAYCPCCMTGRAFTTWTAALAWATTHLRQDHCRFCIDRQMPAGRDDVLGELFERCPACGPACPDCDGIAVYPASYNTPADLTADLETLKLAAVFCGGCHGVVAVIPLDPEVYA